MTLPTCSRTPREGPWQQLGELGLLPPEGGFWTHSTAIEHPELATRCGRRLALTYTHFGAAGGELRRIDITLR